jgi:hypothetical protein
VSILEEAYETGRECVAGFKKGMKIVFNEFLPKGKEFTATGYQMPSRASKSL